MKRPRFSLGTFLRLNAVQLGVKAEKATIFWSLKRSGICDFSPLLMVKFLPAIQGNWTGIFQIGAETGKLHKQNARFTISEDAIADCRSILTYCIQKHACLTC